MINLYHGDCMEAMKDIPDKAYDLAIVDPMYDLPDNYLIPGCDISTTGVKRYHNAQAKKLSKQQTVGYDYFNELIRISKNQIIWGINYFPFASEIPGRIVWDKKNDKSTFSNGELAGCSLLKGLRMFRFMWNGMLQEDMANKEVKIHAYQKTVALYKWLLHKYAKPGDKILDTHGGSMSIAIACHDMGFDLDLWELDEDYYKAGVKRFEQHKQQISIEFI